MYRTDTFRIPMAGPADMTTLIALIEDGSLDPMHIAAILVKTEGNGGVNDFTREYTCATLAATLAPYLRATSAEVERRIAIVVSGGTEGVLSPHATVFARTPVANRAGAAGKRLAIGIAATRDFLPPRDRTCRPDRGDRGSGRGGDGRCRDFAREGCTLGAGEMSAAHRGARAGGAARRPRARDRGRL
jgi:hypothetical protein